MAKSKNFPVNSKANTGKKRIPLRTDESQKSHADSPALDALLLKHAYTFEYRHAQRGQGKKNPTYSPSRNYDAQGVWRRAAESLRAKSINPIDYIPILFSEFRTKYFFCARVPRDHRPPTPEVITGDECMEMYRSAIAIGHKSAELELRLQCSYFDTRCGYLASLYELPLQKAIPRALVNSSMNSFQLTPLSRFCFAKCCLQRDDVSPEACELNERLRMIIDDSFAGACYQYHSNPMGYSSAWPPSVLSPTLPRRAAEIYEALISQITFD